MQDCRTCGESKSPGAYAPRHRTCRACNLKKQALRMRRPLKHCTLCKQVKPASEFPPPHTKQRRCLLCVSAPRRSVQRRAYEFGPQLRRLYGVAPERYLQLLEAQDGRCAICHRTQPGRNRLSVDHNHLTGEVRGLLCNPCNQGLGRLSDSQRKLREALRYLEKYEGVIE